MKRLIAKTVLVIVLTVTLCAASVGTPTFSWYTRPKSQTGSSMQLGGTNGVSYDVSTGNGVTMKTYEGIVEKGALTGYSETEATVTASSATLGAYATKYYKTVITNTSTSAQSLSLFLSQLDLGGRESGNFYLGVNEPTRSYKSYGSVASDIQTTTATREYMRIYFRPHVENGSSDSTWSGKNYYVAYGVNKDPDTYIKLEATGTTDVYYADLPSTATQLFISVQDWSTSKQRTQTFTDIKGDGLSTTQSLLFWLTGAYTSDYNNAYADKAKVNGANIHEYYSSITIPAGTTGWSAALNSANYSGTSIKYYHDSSYTEYLTADEDTGVLNPIKEGTSKLYTKVIGTFKDELQVETEVIIGKKAVDITGKDVPIVTNYKIPGMTTVETPNSDGTTTVSTLAGEETIYWYIKNNSSTSLTYSFKDIYLSL